MRAAARYTINYIITEMTFGVLESQGNSDSFPSDRQQFFRSNEFPLPYVVTFDMAFAATGKHTLRPVPQCPAIGARSSRRARRVSAHAVRDAHRLLVDSGGVRKTPPSCALEVEAAAPQTMHECKLENDHVEARANWVENNRRLASTTARDSSERRRHARSPWAVLGLVYGLVGRYRSKFVPVRMTLLPGPLNRQKYARAESAR